MGRFSLALIALLFGTPLAGESAQAKTATLWKEWYLVTGPAGAAGFYQETAERRSGEKQLSVSQRWVEKERGVVSETYIGAVSADDGKFKPVAFFRERGQGGKVDKVDGRVKGEVLSITIKPARPAGAKQKLTVDLKPATYLSNFVAMILATKPASPSPYAFHAIVEDVRDGDYNPIEGAALITDAKKTIRGLNCRKVTVEFNGQAEWWVAADGRICEINGLDGASHIGLTTEKEAKKALGFK